MDNTTSVLNSSTLDPFTDFPLTFLVTDGPVSWTKSISMPDFVFIWYQNMYLGLVYGAQLGLASLMLVTLFMLTAPGKRRAPIFVLNVVSLVLDLIRSAMMVVWLRSAWNHPVTLFTENFDNIRTSNKVNSMVVNVAKTLELAVILSSLLLQIRVILSTATSMQRGLFLSLAFTLATITICIQLATTAVNSKNIWDFTVTDYLGLQERLADLTRIMTLTTTGLFLLVFVGKLGYAIRRRYKLGVGSVIGPMQIVFVGSLQSMVVPVFFIALQWRADGDFGSLAITILAIQLPLTALWASTSLEERAGISPNQKVNTFKQRPIVLPPQFEDNTGKESKATDSTVSSAGKKKSNASSYRLDTLPMTTTIGSLDVEVKMDERDMV